MKITVFAAGSRGDIQPCVVLGKGLQQAGYQVRLAAPENFASFVQEHGVDFYPLRGDVQQIMASDTGREFMENWWHQSDQIDSGGPDDDWPGCDGYGRGCLRSLPGCDAIICLGVFSAFGQAIAEALNIPIINVEPTPLLWTRAFPAPSWPIQRDLGGWHNYVSGMAMLQVIWQWYRPFIHNFRQRLGLPTYYCRKISIAHYRSTPMLSAYSPSIIPHPADWPENVHITGYFFPDTQTDWQPSPELEAFLEAGDPPVYIGFGSMAGQQPGTDLPNSSWMPSLRAASGDCCSPAGAVYALRWCQRMCSWWTLPLIAGSSPAWRR